MKIGLFGKMRSGKGSVAEMLIKDYGFNSYSFGIGIKEIIDKYFPETLEGGKPRIHYQHIGQELRVLNENVWINYTLSYANKNMGNVLIDDGRQINEANKLKEEGYIIVKVISDDEVRKERIITSGDEFKEEMFEHETEVQIEQIKADYIIENNGTLEELKEKVDKLLKELNFKEYPELKRRDEVKVEKIINVKNKALHLKSFIGKKGKILSWIIDMDRNKKYKVLFENGSTAYFYREELKLEN